MTDLRTTRSRRDGPAGVFAALGLLGVGGGFAAVPAALGYATWAKVQAETRAWAIAGPSCPIVERTTPAVVGRRRPKVFEYGGAEFSRAFGAVSCTAIPEQGLLTHGNYRVCQFNNPGAVTVRANGRTVIFQPPVGGRATVTLRGGTVSCVVGGWFNL